MAIARDFTLRVRLSPAELAALDSLAAMYPWQEQSGNRSEAVRIAIMAQLRQAGLDRPKSKMELQHG